jgi:dihydroxyacetone kinase
MARGIEAAVAAARGATDAASALTAAGSAFADAAGGASGALWGAGLLAMGRTLGGRDPAGAVPTAVDIAAALREATAVVHHLGGATVGDRTLVDGLVPFVEAFPSDARSIADAWESALPAMRTGVAGTAQLVARKGRAATHGANALGSVDAGARSLELALEAVARSLRATCGRAGAGER